MGIYDRDYYQEPGTEISGWQNMSMVTRLIVICGAVALLDLFSPRTLEPHHAAGHWLTNYMALPNDLLQRPFYFWSLVTYGFAHVSISQGDGIWHVALNMYSLWLFGRAVESYYGRREFLRIYLALIVGAGLVWLASQGVASNQRTVLVGASGAVAGILLLFILHFPHERFFVFPLPMPIPAWLLGCIIIGLDLLGAMGYRKDSVAFSAHLAGVALAFVYYRSGIRLTNYSWSGFRGPMMRPRLRVRRPEESTVALEREADRILAKLHEQGAESLSAEERRVLNEYSRRVRQRHQS